MTERNALTILAVEGPILRAYASALRHLGVRPRRVIAIAPRSDPITRKEVGRWLPNNLRAIYAARIDDARQNYWPRRLKRTAPGLVEAMSELLAARFPYFKGFFDALEGPSNYRGWAETDDTLLADGLGDPALADTLAGAGTVLFTGGGRVPTSLLAIPRVQFLHIHPGLIPYVRGADGLLWSTLVRGRHGRTAFLMTPDLDAGPIVHAEEVEPMRFFLDGRTRPEDQVLYRALYSYYDPCFRAELAAKLLKHKLPCPAQNQEARFQNEGFIFPFMSGRLRAATLFRIFPSK
jgi:hypothetical protein